MKTRLKTFSEFKKGITYVSLLNGGARIFSSISPRPTVLAESRTKFWNSKETKKGYLLHLYINHVIWKADPSKKITRIEGFELLGRRIMHNDIIAVIIQAQDVVNTDTGEVDVKLLVCNKLSTNTFTILKSSIQL